VLLFVAGVLPRSTLIWRDENPAKAGKKTHSISAKVLRLVQNQLGACEWHATDC